MTEQKYYIGVDVGTGSTRAAIVRDDGHIVTTATHPINIWNPEPNFYEQSSDNIWEAVVSCVKTVLSDSGVDKDAVRGMGFDATCSLVVLDKDFNSVSVSKTGQSECNVVMWMDHRAAEQADRINLTNHPVLQQCGGKISLEMEPPKLLWLKQNLQTQCWARADHLFDLPDFLTWRSTGSLSRSLCSLACKWGYQANIDGFTGWNESFLQNVGLEDLIENNFGRIGNDVRPPGTPCGEGLSQSAAAQLGLKPGTPVGASIVDAHAGVLGSLACTTDTLEKPPIPITNRMALICGTSTCHMSLSDEPRYVPGVWGPYYSAIIPGVWNTEGGQSAAGKLLDHVVETHVAFKDVQTTALTREESVYAVLNQVLKELAHNNNMASMSRLTQHLHVWPDFHGNRAPLADPNLTGMVCGLTLSSGVEDLARLYLATLQALSYGTRHILEALSEKGQITKVIHICGGLAKNPLFVTTHADVTGVPVVLPDEPESVLLGAAILGACASGTYSDVQAAMRAMGGKGQVIQPNTNDISFHDQKYKVFLRMVDDQYSYRNIMDNFKETLGS